MTEDIVTRLKSVSAEVAPYANALVLNWCHQAAAEIERLRAHVEALQQKIDADKSCACAYDSPDDVCLPHSPVVAGLRAENDRLRAALAQSDQPCAYCSLPAAEWAKCASGFPGCGRADDAMGCPELGAALERDQLRANLSEAIRLMEPVAEAEKYTCWPHVVTLSRGEAYAITDFLKRMKGVQD